VANLTESDAHASHEASTKILCLSALGMVFGDIGTSPLYTLKTVLDLTEGTLDRGALLGSLSLIIWTLVLVTWIKYVNFAMRVDNDGEGGILALMSLLGIKLQPRPFIVAIGLIGAALIYGDGAITPAISVLSALEGLSTITPAFDAYVLPLAVIILVALFSVQCKGTARIGNIFGPVMILWFLALAAMGIWGVVQHPSVLLAINPIYGLRYLLTHGTNGFFILGGVFLCVTGAEALYADMGHFGARPIRLVWSGIVFPSLVINYAGQTALILDGASPTDNMFYKLCPEQLLMPLVILATLATIIASQAIITGAFSMTKQAIQLGWLPRLEIKQTSARGYGQIYVSVVNWLLMIVTVGITIGFKKSDNLASAYGIAVSATMLATSVLLYIAMREVWKWGFIRAFIVASIFIIVDTCFFLANLSKFFDGGYVPILLAALIYGVMFVWHRGMEAVSERVREELVPMDVFMTQIQKADVPRVQGTAIFLTRTEQNVPPVMVWHVRKNHVLHQQVLILKVKTVSMPWTNDDKQLTFREVAHGVWRGTASYGFMERPDIPRLLKQAEAAGCPIDLNDMTYYIGHETIIPWEDDKSLPRWMEAIFAFMQRNSLHLSDYFQLPPDEVVEIGRQVSI